MELIEICRSVAESKLSEGKHQEALPAAQFYLRCSVDVHGPNTIQLVSPYLLLADANMRKERSQTGSPPKHCPFLLNGCFFFSVCALLPAFSALGNVTLVKEFLAQAEWIVFRNPDCSHAIRHRLHRSLGRLNVLTGDLDAALMHFANDVRVVFSTLSSLDCSFSSLY